MLITAKLFINKFIEFTSHFRYGYGYPYHSGYYGHFVGKRSADADADANADADVFYVGAACGTESLHLWWCWFFKLKISNMYVFRNIEFNMKVWKVKYRL